MVDVLMALCDALESRLKEPLGRGGFEEGKSIGNIFIRW